MVHQKIITGPIHEANNVSLVATWALPEHHLNAELVGVWLDGDDQVVRTNQDWSPSGRWSKDIFTMLKSRDLLPTCPGAVATNLLSSRWPPHDYLVVARSCLMKSLFLATSFGNQFSVTITHHSPNYLAGNSHWLIPHLPATTPNSLAADRLEEVVSPVWHNVTYFTIK